MYLRYLDSSLSIIYFRSNKTVCHFTLLLRVAPLFTLYNLILVTSVRLNAKSRLAGHPSDEIVLQMSRLIFLQRYKYTHTHQSPQALILRTFTHIINWRYQPYCSPHSLRHEMGRLLCEFRPCLVGVFISRETRLVLRAVDAMGVTRAATKGHIHSQSL